MHSNFWKIVCWLMSFSLIFSSGFTPIASAESIFPRGDVNGDDAINASDADDIKDRVLRRTHSPFEHERFDFNDDGKIDVSDVLRVLKYDGDWDGDRVMDSADAFDLDPQRDILDPADSGFPEDAELIDTGSIYASDDELELVHLQRVDEDAVLPGGTAGDADGDGIGDVDEESNCTDSLLIDTDRDGWNDGADLWPNEPDHDFDGYLDGREITAGTDPNDVNAFPAGTADLSDAQIAALRQAVPPACGAKAAGGGGSRGRGFQGPASVGSGFESVQSDQFTGAFSYSIPITVPPGRNGMQPNIDLLYRSSNSHSWLGVGWALEPGRIERATKNGAPKYHSPASPPASDGDPFTPLDNPDTFLHVTSGGGNELVYIQTVGGTAVYHSVVDNGEFTRYLFHTAGQYWEAQSKTGTREFFGGNPNSNPGTGDVNSVQLRSATETFAWGIDEAWDQNGDVNKIAYLYVQPAGTNNMYLDEIRYNYVGGLPKVVIDFERADRGSNPSWASYRESYRPGMKVTSEHFLQFITLSVSGHAAAFTPPKASDRVRKYVLEYHPLDVQKGRTISCLKSCQELGETDADAFPATELAYSENQGVLQSSSDFSGPPDSQRIEFFHRGETNTGTIAADINGDGMVDLWRRYGNGGPSGHHNERWLNTGKDFASTPLFVGPNDPADTVQFFHQGEHDTGTRAVDINGDGLLDLWQRWGDGTPAGFFNRRWLNDGSDFVSTSDYVGPTFTTSQLSAEFNHRNNGDRGVRPADINGDGLVDLWQRISLSETGPILQQRLLNNGSAFVSTSNFSWTSDGEFHNESHTSGRGTYPMDINGDGLTDIWRRLYRTTPVATFQQQRLINTGSGFVNSSDFSWTTNTEFFAQDNKERGTVAADLNGDGLLDLWQRLKIVGSSIERVALNTGIGFVSSAAFTWNMNEAAFWNDSDVAPGAQAVDLNGDGLVDLWQRFSDSTPAGFLNRRILNSGPTPNLLISIDNGKGGAVNIEYSPQTKAWMSLYDPEPSRRVEPNVQGVETNNRIPYVLHCVSKVTRTGLRPNHLNPSDVTTPTSGTTSESYSTLYRYSGGQHLDREFRGFGKVKEIDAQTGNFTITEFHQDYARKGQVKAVRSYVAHRDAYLDGGQPVKPVDEAIVAQNYGTLGTPALVSESYTRYQVLIHENDPNRAKTFTKTSADLGLADFPLGVTLVTPASTLTRTYEYINAAGDGDDYTRPRNAVPALVTASEQFFDGRGNLLQSINRGQVDILPGANLDDPVIGITFTSDASGSNADGAITQATRYETKRNGSWVDVPVLSNAAGFHWENDALVLDEKILQASSTSYDPLHRPTAMTASLDTGPDPVTEYTYDVYGNITQTKDPRGNVTSIIYDLGCQLFPKTVTNALGHQEEYVFDPGFGVLLTHTDANGHVRRATYDALGRTTGLYNSTDDLVTSYQYEFWTERDGITAPSRVRTTTHTPTGDVWSETHFDGLARPYQTLAVGQNGASDPIRTVTYFNDRGAPWKVSQPHWLSQAAGTLHYTYKLMENDNTTVAGTAKAWAKPGLDRVREQRAELNATESAQSFTIYESPLSVKTKRNRGDKNIERRAIADAFGNAVSVWEPDTDGSVGSLSAPLGQMTRFGFDAVGRMQFVRRHFAGSTPQLKDTITRIGYDTLGRRTLLDDPDSGISTFRYDANGNQTEVTDARQLTVQHFHDALNRLTKTVYADTTTGILREHRLTYDSGTGENLIGRLASTNSPGAAAAFSYDAEGRGVRTRRTIDSVTYETSSTWDFANRELQRVYPGGMRINYAYDAATQGLDSVSDADTGQVYLKNKTHDAFGLETLSTLGNGPGGNGVTRSYTRDFTGRATQQLTEQVPGGADLSSLTYTFDRSSNITRIQELVGALPRGDMRYTYDTLDRLLTGYGTTMSGEAAGASNTPRFAYSYDAFGRMTANSRFKNSNLPQASPVYSYEADTTQAGPANAVRDIRLQEAGETDVIAHTFIYDAAGNLTASTNGAGATASNALTRTMSWDALGRLTAVTTPQRSSQYTYDNSTQRVKKTDSSGNSVIYVGDIVEVTATGMTKHIFAGSQRIATIKPDGQKLFYMADHLDSSAIITDINGNVVQRMDYEPYGAALNNTRSGNTAGIRHTYTGQESDSETGLMYYNARYYDPVVGAFSSSDSIIPEVRDPRSYNRFAYVRGNPLRYTDPSGHSWLSKVIDRVSEKVKDATKKTESSYHKVMPQEVRQTHAYRSIQKRIDRTRDAVDAKYHGSTSDRLFLFAANGAGLAMVAAGPVAHEVLSDPFYGDAVGSAIIAGGSLLGPAGTVAASALVAGYKSSADPTSREFITSAAIAGVSAYAGMQAGAAAGGETDIGGYVAKGTVKSFAKASATALDEGKNANGAMAAGLTAGMIGGVEGIGAYAFEASGVKSAGKNALKNVYKDVF